MRAVLALAGLELRRFLADRFNLFFVFILPLMLVGVLGLQSGAAPPVRVAVAEAGATGAADQGSAAAAGGAGQGSATGPGDVVTSLTEQLTDLGVEATAYDDRDQLEDAVGAGSDLGVLVRSVDPLELELVSVGAPPPGPQQLVQTAADEVAVDLDRAAVLAGAGLDPEQAQRVAAGPQDWSAVPVQVVSDNPMAEEFAGAGRFEIGASGQLLLFVFLNTLGASAAMIAARRSGAVRRGLAAPVTAGQTVTGLALGRLVIALFQAAWIIGMSSLLFGVAWGSLPAVLVVMAVFGLIASGLAMVVGVVMDGEGPASGLSVGAGLVLAALGGCMMPLEFFPDGLRRVAMFTPHGWGYEALAEITRRDGGVLDVLPQLGVLAAMAVAVLALGAWLLRRSLDRAL